MNEVKCPDSSVAALRRLPQRWRDSVHRLLSRPAKVSEAPAKPDPVDLAFEQAGLGSIEPKNVYTLLHHLRGLELERLPQGLHYFVSVGCAGTWYFEWIASKCAPRRHVGIEFYAPMPHDLPADCEWICNTAGNMSDLSNGVGDLVFSGQNIEHLWPHDISGFLLESNRVLKAGGLLVVDSPNRLVTGPSQWHHTEHILEFTPDEAVEIAGAAGFDVVSLRGLWHCPRSSDGVATPIEDVCVGPADSLRQRIQDAGSAPNESFVWWMVARKTDRAPDAGRVRELVLSAFRKAWPARVHRSRLAGGSTVHSDGEEWRESTESHEVILYGPYIPMPPGSFSIGFKFRALANSEARSGPLAKVDVFAGQDVLAQRVIQHEELAAHGGEYLAMLPVEFPETTFGVEFRVIALGNGIFRCAHDVTMVGHSDSAYDIPACPDA